MSTKNVCGIYIDKKAMKREHDILYYVNNTM